VRARKTAVRMNTAEAHVMQRRLVAKGAGAQPARLPAGGDWSALECGPRHWRSWDDPVVAARAGSLRMG